MIGPDMCKMLSIYHDLGVCVVLFCTPMSELYVDLMPDRSVISSDQDLCSVGY